MDRTKCFNLALCFKFDFCLISDETRAVIRGQTVTLTCPVDIEHCGELHSIKWFRGTERIAVLSGDGKYTNVEGLASDR